MRVKQLLLSACIILQGTWATASDNVIFKEWDFEGKQYRLSTEPYGEALVETFRGITMDFHLADVGGRKQSEGDHGNLEAALQYARNFVEERGCEFQDGKSSFLGLFRNKELISGAYFRLEQDGTVVRILQAGQKLDLTPQEVIFSQLYSLNELSSRERFPKAEKLVLSLRRDSDYIKLLGQYEFKESKYITTDPDLPEGIYQNFERSIS